MKPETKNIHINLKIPEDIDFSDLHLALTGENLTLRWEPIEKICIASGIDIALYSNESEYQALGLIGAWYRAHLKHGGSRNQVADILFAEELAQEGIQEVSIHLKA